MGDDETETHKLVFEWQRDRSEYFKRDILEIVEGFAEWMMTRRPPPGNALTDLAERLTPNPALTAAGTLAIILDGIDKLDSSALARALARVNRRKAFGVDEGPITDEQWRTADLEGKMALIGAAESLKEALREATKNG